MEAQWTVGYSNHGLNPQSPQKFSDIKPIKDNHQFGQINIVAHFGIRFQGLCSFSLSVGQKQIRGDRSGIWPLSRWFPALNQPRATTMATTTIKVRAGSLASKLISARVRILSLHTVTEISYTCVQVCQGGGDDLEFFCLIGLVYNVISFACKKIHVNLSLIRDLHN